MNIVANVLFKKWTLLYTSVFFLIFLLIILPDQVSGNPISDILAIWKQLYILRVSLIFEELNSNNIFSISLMIFLRVSAWFFTLLPIILLEFKRCRLAAFSAFLIYSLIAAIVYNLYFD
jgi:hypothetical protein